MGITNSLSTCILGISSTVMGTKLFIAGDYKQCLKKVTVTAGIWPKFAATIREWWAPSRLPLWVYNYE